MLYCLLFLATLPWCYSADSDSKKIIYTYPNYVTGDFQPIVHNDSLLYFTRKYYKDNTNGELDPDDIWCAERHNNSWLAPTNIGTPLNTSGSDVLFSLLPDGKTALVNGIYASVFQGKQPGFSIARLSKSGWQTPEPLFIRDYYSASQGYFGSLAADGRTLLLAAERKESLGGLDLYVSFFIDSLQEWSAPKHLGGILNSSATEATPYLAPDGTTLYFSSERSGGKGGADIYMSRRLDNSWQQWSIPQPLASINSTGEDAGFTLANNGLSGYCLSTNDSTGEKSIYKLSLPESLQPRRFLRMEGTSSLPKDKENVAYCSVFDTKLQRIGRAFLHKDENSNLATFTTAVPFSDSVIVVASAQGCLPVASTITTKNSSDVISCSLPPLSLQDSLPTLFVLFAQADSSLQPAYLQTIAVASEILTSNPAIRLTLSGHADERGSDSLNIVLSERRTRAVYELLAQSGAPLSRIQTRYVGESEPLTKGKSPEELQKNRRVELRFSVVEPQQN